MYRELGVITAALGFYSAEGKKVVQSDGKQWMVNNQKIGDTKSEIMNDEVSLREQE